MASRRVLVEPAKSGRGQCKKCKKAIAQDSLRVQIVDDRKFNQYIRTHGGRSVFHGEGMSRGGYIETERGVISIERYFVHLSCYIPIHPHPYTKEWFRCQKFKARHQSAFEDYLRVKIGGKATCSDPPSRPEKAPKKTSKKKAISKLTKTISRVSRPQPVRVVRTTRSRSAK